MSMPEDPFSVFLFDCMLIAALAYLCLLMRHLPWTQRILKVVKSIERVCILLIMIVGFGKVFGELQEIDLIILASVSLFTFMMVPVGYFVFCVRTMSIEPYEFPVSLQHAKVNSEARNEHLHRFRQPCVPRPRGRMPRGAPFIAQDS